MTRTSFDNHQPLDIQSRELSTVQKSEIRDLGPRFVHFCPWCFALCLLTCSFFLALGSSSQAAERPHLVTVGRQEGEARLARYRIPEMLGRKQ